MAVGFREFFKAVSLVDQPLVFLLVVRDDESGLVLQEVFQVAYHFMF